MSRHRVRGLFVVLFVAGCSSSIAGPRDSDAQVVDDGGAAEGNDASSHVDASAADGGMPDLDSGAATDASTDAGSDAGSDAGPVIHCDPTGAGPYYLLEGDSVQVQLSCTTGLTVKNSAFSIDDLPLGAAFDPKTATLSWTPTLDQAAVYELTLRVSPWGETSTLKIGVADRWDDVNNVPIADASTYTEEFGLPVIHISTDPGINGDLYTPASIVSRGHSYVGAEAKYRGAFSGTFPKHSYTLKFTKTDKFSEPASAGGFLAKRKVTLITTFDDNSYLRQRLAYEMWNRLDPAHIQIQTYSAVVFLNGAYYGLYTVADHVDGYLMEDHGLLQEGNLYKARDHDANFRSTRSGGGAKSTLHQGYTKEEGTPLDGEPGAYDDLDALVSWVATSSDQSFAGEIDTRLSRSEYEDWWLFVSFVMADDSAGKNSYHYHDPTDPNGVWRFIPWDMNQSFGQEWRTFRVSALGTTPEGYYLQMNHLFERILADATLGPALRARYGEVLHGVYDLETLLALCDAMSAELATSATRDAEKWDATYRAFGAWSSRSDFLSPADEALYVRQWIIDRHAYLDTLY